MKKAAKSKKKNVPDKTVKQAAGQKADKSKDIDRVELIKQAAGQMTSATSIAKVFLDDRFPKWKEDNKTHMIPPMFKAKDSYHQIGIPETKPYSNSGDNGESIIYELLRELGNQKDMGMFVINGLNLDDIKSWKIYSLVKLPCKDAEKDFIIFHHRLGLIFIEVKNTSRKDIRQERNKAKDQLKGSVDLMKKFSEPRMEVLSNETTRADASNHSYNFSIPYKKVMAFPLTVNFNPQSVDPDTLVLLKDDCQDLASFQKWWEETIERDATEMSSVETLEAYKRALSTALMICHFCPVTETEGVEEIHKSLISFDFHGTKKSKPFPQLMEDEFPFLWRWCRDVLDQKIKKDPAMREEGKKSPQEKELQDSFMKKHKLNEEDLRKGKGMPLLNTLLKNQKYIEGDKYSPTDDAISAVFEDHYCLFYENILRYTNTMREMVPDIKEEEMVPDIKEEQVATKVQQQEVLPETNNQEFLPHIKGLVLLDTNNQEVSPETKDQDVSPRINDKEVIPEFNECEVLPKLHEMFPFTKLETPRDFNLLDRHLEKCRFIQQDEPSILDKQLYKELLRKTKFVRSHQPHQSILLTLEQLVIFEGPRKQLIIGPPGSGKTELLKFRALKQNDYEANKPAGRKKIMYILANGSPDYPARNSLFFHDIKEFFKDVALVEVISIVLEEESEEDTKQTTSEIRKKIKSKKYGHAFIDEYWIGSKPKEHQIILELVRGLPGYVWISSVFDYDQELIKCNERMIQRTQPLLTALNEKKGKVQRITQVMRGTNSIIELERDYSRLYGKRSYPYGTEEILGHSYVGLPVTWVVEESVDGMYEQCVDIVKRAITDGFSQGEADERILTIKPKDIVVVDFAIRTEESSQLKKSLPSRFSNNDIPVWRFGENHRGTMEKIALLQSAKRSASEFLDGVERKMVVVILPSGLVLKTAKLADKADQLRNYDTYISFFRTMVKLVVISDKWESKKKFLDDIRRNIPK